MIEFYAGTGPDTQAVGIALEEMFLDYRVMPGKARLPAVAIGGARLVGAPNIVLALARKTNRFLVTSEEAAVWVSKTPDAAALETQLASAEFILGRVSIADMTLYPRIAADKPLLASHAAIGGWAERMMRRSAVGRGMNVVGA